MDATDVNNLVASLTQTEQCSSTARECFEMVQLPTSLPTAGKFIGSILLQAAIGTFVCYMGDSNGHSFVMGKTGDATYVLIHSNSDMRNPGKAFPPRHEPLDAGRIGNLKSGAESLSCITGVNCGQGRITIGYGKGFVFA